MEAGLTILAELLWSKERILEIYLNIAEFGDGTYGVGSAAKRFFGKNAATSQPAGGVPPGLGLPSPKRLRAERPSAYLNRRARWVQIQMRQLGSKHIDWN